MNPVRRFFDALHPHVEPGAKYEKLYAFYESIETVFFAPLERTRRLPAVRDSLDVKRYMFLVIVALIPHLCFGIYNAGYFARMASGLSLAPVPVVLTGLWLVMPMVIVTYVVGFFWEILFATIRKHEISEGLFVTCMLFPLTLPPATPLWQVALGISFGIVIGKEVFGGTGRNFLNPALTARAFLYFAYPVSLSGDNVWSVLVGGAERYVDGYTAATPLSVAASTTEGQTVEAALEALGYSPLELFFGLYPGSVGGTTTFLSIIGAIFMIVLGIASWRTILGGVLGVLATAYFLNFIAGPDSMPFLSLKPYYHLLIGGSAFALVYMTTDPVSGTHMKSVKWFYGFMCGLLTVLIRVFNPAFPEGVGLAILFMNCFNPLLDYIEVKIRTRRRVPNV